MGNNSLKFIVKIHEINGKKVVAICDKELLGKSFESDDFVLNLDPVYFGNEENNIPENLINEDKVIVHAVGLNAVNKLKELNLIQDEDVIYVENIPVVMFYNIKDE